jgi:hypothetical protein
VFGGFALLPDHATGNFARVASSILITVSGAAAMRKFWDDPAGITALAIPCIVVLVIMAGGTWLVWWWPLVLPP